MRATIALLATLVAAPTTATCMIGARYVQALTGQCDDTTNNAAPQ